MSPAASRRTIRARWAAIGAAVAVTLGAGTITGTLPIVDAVTSSGERTVYTAVVPCRLIDTRPDAQFNVGPRTTPLGQGETDTFDARGAQGECPAASLPDDAVALALNVTALDATADGFLTFWADGTRPNAASLNPSPAQPPVPNAVTTEQSASGSFNVYNENGTVDIVIDVLGYYTDHNHDDRYYTETEADARFAPNAAVGDVISVHAFDWLPLEEEWSYEFFWSRSAGPDACMFARIDIPSGASVERVDITYSSTGATADVFVLSQARQPDPLAAISDVVGRHLAAEGVPLPASGATSTASVQVVDDPTVAMGLPLVPAGDDDEYVRLCSPGDVALLSLDVVLD